MRSKDSYPTLLTMASTAAIVAELLRCKTIQQKTCRIGQKTWLVSRLESTMPVPHKLLTSCTQLQGETLRAERRSMRSASDTQRQQTKTGNAENRRNKTGRMYRLPGVHCGDMDAGKIKDRDGYGPYLLPLAWQ